MIWSLSPEPAQGALTLSVSALNKAFDMRIEQPFHHDIRIVNVPPSGDASRNTRESLPSSRSHSLQTKPIYCCTTPTSAGVLSRTSRSEATRKIRKIESATMSNTQKPRRSKTVRMCIERVGLVSQPVLCLTGFVRRTAGRNNLIQINRIILFPLLWG
jgi:hypothetical protein